MIMRRIALRLHVTKGTLKAVVRVGSNSAADSAAKLGVADVLCCRNGGHASPPDR
jgi:hypothetical protein